ANGGRGPLWIGPRGNGQAAAGPLTNHARVREAAFDAAPVPQVIVDAQGLLALANLPARAQFNLGAKDLGLPLHELELSYRPVELRPLIDQAFAENRPVLLKDVEWRRADGDADYLDLQVHPLRDGVNGLLGVSISYLNVT